MGSEYETGSRPPLIGSYMHRLLTETYVQQRSCGCTYLGSKVRQQCPRHTSYVIQEEP